MRAVVEPFAQLVMPLGGGGVKHGGVRWGRFLPLGFLFGVVHVEHTSIGGLALLPTGWKRRV